MHILFITHKYPPTIGGMEKQSFELTTRVPAPHLVTIHAYKGEGSKLKWFLNLKKEIKAILKNQKDIDIIHVNDGLMAAATVWLKKFTDIPVVATYHGLDITFPSKIFQQKIIKNLHRLDAGICVSRATAQACIDRGFEKEHIYTVLNGVDHDLADIPNNPNFLAKLHKEKGINLQGKTIIMTMGRAVKRKGFSWFLKNVIPSLTDNTVFVMVGPLNTKKTLTDRLVALIPKGLRTKVHLMFGIPTDVDAIVQALDHPSTKGKVFHMGKVPFSDLMQFLGAAHLFVMPNIKVPGDAEGFGLVALEASLRGAPVIASGIEGITDAVIDGENGILLRTGDAAQWIDTLTQLTADKNKLQTMSEKAISSVLEHYSWDKMVKEYIAIFQSIISK